VIKDGSRLRGNFLLKHVVPNLCTWFSADVANVVAKKQLLWMLFLLEKNYLPYNNIRVLPADSEPYVEADK
jgi:hypothetical protein